MSPQAIPTTIDLPRTFLRDCSCGHSAANLAALLKVKTMNFELNTMDLV